LGKHWQAAADRVKHQDKYTSDHKPKRAERKRGQIAQRNLADQEVESPNDEQDEKTNPNGAAPGSLAVGRIYAHESAKELEFGCNLVAIATGINYTDCSRQYRSTLGTSREVLPDTRRHKIDHKWKTETKAMRRAAATRFFAHVFEDAATIG
jgi:hypothetical protein